METLIDYMRTDLKYREEGNRLLRPDDSVAAVLNQERWRTFPFPEEMAEFSSSCGRAFPSRYIEKDLTNIGHK